MTPRDWILTELRCASLRARLITTEIDEIGIALKFNMISPEGAVRWLHDAGLDGVFPTDTGAEVAA
jgi:hypothetical protein